MNLLTVAAGALAVLLLYWALTLFILRFFAQGKRADEIYEELLERERREL